MLDTIEIHGDVADVAEQPRARAIGRDVDVLVDVGAIELERVGASSALNRVTAIAWIPDERVIACSQQGHVVAAPAVDQIVARTADDGVIAVTAIKREIDRAGMQLGGIDGVIAGEPVDDEVVLAGFGAADRHLCRQPVDQH